MTATAWILALLAALLVFAAIIFNRFVGLGQRRRNAFGDIDVQLKRRWDLVPSLVETVRGYAGHEHDVLAEVTSARARAMDPAAELSQRARRESGLAGALHGVFVVAEDYPALKADSNFLALHRTLVEVENDLQHARRYYNAVVRDLNTLRQSIPSNMVGAAVRVPLAEYFQLDDDQRSVPSVDLNPTHPPEKE